MWSPCAGQCRMKLGIISIRLTIESYECSLFYNLLLSQQVLLRFLIKPWFSLQYKMQSNDDTGKTEIKEEWMNIKTWVCLKTKQKQTTKKQIKEHN